MPSKVRAKLPFCFSGSDLCYDMYFSVYPSGGAFTNFYVEGVVV